jgi:hypothetical protein
MAAMDIDNTTNTLDHWLKDKVDTNESIHLDEGWDRFQKDGIQQLHDMLKGTDISRPPFSTAEYAMLYNLTYTMSGHLSSHDYSLELYHRCKDSIETFLVTEMIPMMRSSDLNTALDIVQVATSFITLRLTHTPTSFIALPRLYY